MRTMNFYAIKPCLNGSSCCFAKRMYHIRNFIA